MTAQKEFSAHRSSALFSPLRHNNDAGEMRIGRPVGADDEPHTASAAL